VPPIEMPRLLDDEPAVPIRTEEPADLRPILDAIAVLRGDLDQKIGALAATVDELSAAVRELSAKVPSAPTVDVTPVLTAIDSERAIEISLPALGTARGRMLPRT
jgi:hypothetical protein